VPISILFLQAVSLLPNAPTPALPASAACLRIQVAAETKELPKTDTLDSLKPRSKSEVLELAANLGHFTNRELQLFSTVAAGATADSPFSLALIREGLRRPDTTTALSCLLSPADVPPSALPALAWLATDSSKALELRAAAISRLLSARCRSSWPLARTILLTGTPSDTPTAMADWPRTGRYELPKRLLVLEIDRIFSAEGLPPCEVEPNAAWKLQVQQVSTLDERMTRFFSSATKRFALQPIEEQQDFARQLAKLLTEQKDVEHAANACSLLLPHATPTLQIALTKNDPKLTATVRKVMTRF